MLLSESSAAQRHRSTSISVAVALEHSILSRIHVNKRAEKHTIQMLSVRTLLSPKRLDAAPVELHPSTPAGRRAGAAGDGHVRCFHTDSEQSRDANNSLVRARASRLDRSSC